MLSHLSALKFRISAAHTSHPDAITAAMISFAPLDIQVHRVSFASAAQ
jgi:hypothetical protein